MDRDAAYLVVNDAIRIPRDEIAFTFVRSSGPGGQNVNKVNSKAVLRWSVAGTAALPEEVQRRFLALHRRRITNEGELVIAGQRFRDAPKNVEDCLQRLVELVLAAATVPKTRRKTKPSRASHRRRLSDKRRAGEKKMSRKPPTGE